MKQDLKPAFCHPSQCTRSLVTHFPMEWRILCGYVSNFLPFGLHIAPRIFNLFAEALHWIFSKMEGHTSCSVPTGYYRCSEITQTLRWRAGWHGLLRSYWEEYGRPVITHLGYEFGTLEMEVPLLTHKNLCGLSPLWGKHSLCDFTQTNSLLPLPLLSSPLRKPLLRNLFSLLHRSNKPYYRGHIQVSKTDRQDLWWLKFRLQYPWSSQPVSTMMSPQMPVAYEAPVEYTTENCLHSASPHSITLNIYQL